jgi:hypothetical protein
MPQGKNKMPPRYAPVRLPGDRAAERKSMYGGAVLDYSKSPAPIPRDVHPLDGTGFDGGFGGSTAAAEKYMQEADAARRSAYDSLAQEIENPFLGMAEDQAPVAGGNGGASYRAMIDYLEGSRPDMLRPYQDAEGRIQAAYGEGSQRLREAQQAMLARIAAATADQQRIAADRDLAIERSAATYSPQAQAALQGILADLAAQGGNAAPLNAVAALRGQQAADLAAREAAMRAQMDAAMKTRLSGYSTASEQQGAAAQSALELARANATSGLAQRRAAAEAALNQRIAEMRARL